MDTVLITGTTSGIGKAFVEKFASMGNNIILVSKNRDQLQHQQIDLQTRYQVMDESQWIKIPDHHPAIISRELFDQVQAQRPRFKCPKKNANAYPLRCKNRKAPGLNWRGK